MVFGTSRGGHTYMTCVGTCACAFAHARVCVTCVVCVCVMCVYVACVCRVCVSCVCVVCVCRVCCVCVVYVSCLCVRTLFPRWQNFDFLDIHPWTHKHSVVIYGI